MEDSMSDNGGCFVWYDLMTTDPGAAADFYTALVGWGTQPWEGSPEPYTMWTNDGTPLGGVAELPKAARESGAPPHWLAYVHVPDVAATAARVEEMGGQVMHPPTDIPGAGRFAVLADPHGAVFAIYAHSGEGSELPDPSKVGQISWHELATSDFEAAFDFYQQLFGWTTKEDMDMGGGAIYRLYGQPDGMPQGGMFTKPKEMPGPPMWLFYIRVADIHAAAEKVQSLGGQVINGPMEVPGGDLIAQCVDPQGAMFAIHGSA
jgi:predicted enzyme related to lactoylglutathione lyase